MLGWLKLNNSAIDGYDYTNYKTFSNPLDPTDPSSPIFTVTDQGEYVDPDPFHSVSETAGQIFGTPTNHSSVGTMDGFIASYARAFNTSIAPQIMAGLKPTAVPVITTLAMEFALFDRFFSALPGPTYPNRLFTYAATSTGYGDNPANVTIEGWANPPIMKTLDDVGGGVGWRVYEEEVSTALLWQYTRPHLLDGHFRSMDKFTSDAAAGLLPVGLTILDPSYFTIPGKPASDQHPAHDVVEGEKLIKMVYESLRSSPQWNSTALVIVWDEHGGFYDHVVPPTSGVPNPDGIPCISGCGETGFNFTSLGVRIPAVVVSPWIPKGTLINAPPEAVKPTPTSEFELSSIPATLHRVFGTADYLTQRDAWAAPFDFVWSSPDVTEPRTDCPMTLPDPPAQSPSFIGRTDIDGSLPLTHLQEDLLVLAHAVLGTGATPEDLEAFNAEHSIDTEGEAGAFIRAEMRAKVGSKYH